ncbi:MAG: response regulator [Planctomycetes bacterium]|nr:response regulator [Planctomycetota bacterium]
MALFRRRKIDSIPSLPVAELRKRTRVLVIDDDENSFPIALLKREGYAIDYWPKVEDLARLERGEYDIIVLDIRGVAEHWSVDDGLGVLEAIKEANPAQVVVAFSGQSFDLSKNRFWRLADDSLPKPVDAAKCKRLLDNLMQQKLTIRNYWGTVSGILRNGGVPERKISGIEDKVVRALERKDKKGVTDILSSTVENAEVLSRLARLAAKMAALLGL